MTESVHFIATSSFITTPVFELDFVSDTYLVNNPTGVDVKLIASAKFESVFVPFPRITEEDDVRITESGDSRVTENSSENTAEGTFVAVDTKIPFNSDLFVKYLSNYKIAVPYVKYNDVWVVPIRTYRFMNNAWKRIN